MDMDFKPMMPETTGKSPEDFDPDEWIAEPKYNGSRVIIDCSGENARLFDKKGEEHSEKFSDLLNRFDNKSAVIDGELIWKDNDGNNFYRPLTSDRQELLLEEGLIPYIVMFDIMVYGGNNIEDLSLKDRRTKLLYETNSAYDGDFRIEHSDSILRMYERYVVDKGFEGIILKRKDSEYQAGEKSSDWLVLEPQRKEYVLIVGITGSDINNIETLVMSNGDNYIGEVRKGFDGEELLNEIEMVERKESHFTESKIDFEFEPVEPFVAEIQFQKITSEGKLKHPVFRSIQEDKDSNDVDI